MTYIRDFGTKLEALLQDVEPEKRKKIIKLCKDTVIESYRNGQNAPHRGERKDQLYKK